LRLHDDADDEQQLTAGIQLADQSRLALEMPCQAAVGQRTADDDNIAQDDDRGQPDRDKAQTGQAEESRYDQQLVGGRIQQAPELRPPAERLGQVAVDSVGCPGDDDQQQGQIVAVAEQGDDQRYDQHDSHDTDRVGYPPESHGPAPTPSPTRHAGSNTSSPVP